MPILRGPAKGLKWVVGSSTHGCWLGVYEIDKQRILERFVKAEMTVYDVGAQAGFYSLLFSRLVGDKGQVYAFEPFAENVRYLIRHIGINGLCNIQVVQVALADRSRIAPFTVNRGVSQNTLLNDQHAALLIPTLSLEEAVESHGLPPPDLVKMDVEGSESLVLSGAGRILERWRPVLFISLHGATQRRDCQMLLHKAGYRLFDCAGNSLSGPLQIDEIYALPGASQREVEAARA